MLTMNMCTYNAIYYYSEAVSIKNVLQRCHKWYYFIIHSLPLGVGACWVFGLTFPNDNCLELYIITSLYEWVILNFRRWHSTELSVLQLVIKITEQMDIGKIPLNKYMDLSKVFDTFVHWITRYYSLSWLIME